MKRILLLTPILAAALTALPAVGQDKKKAETYTDPKKVDEDYAIQGEYVGEVQGEKVGAQVVALGDGKFDVIGYIGGLPGAGWTGEAEGKQKGSGERSSDAVAVTGTGWTASIKDGAIAVSGEDGSDWGTLKRTERKSPTLGAKPPEGAVVLFDGSSVDGWEKGKMTDDKLLMQGTRSKQKFRDFTIHLEFRTPYKPKARGQGRGNSGFYAQGRYEVQILDSFGLEGKMNEAGGIYSVGAPKMNMCYPPLTWQTYDIDFTAARFDGDGKKTSDARMTVKHNGVVIHKDVVCDHATTASPLKEGPEPGPVYFQDHGNPIVFRNVWVLEKKR